MTKIDINQVDEKVKSASAILGALQCIFFVGAVISIVTFVTTLAVSPIAAFMSALSAIGCYSYSVSCGSRRKVGENRYEIIRHDYMESQRVDAYRSVIGEELDKRFPADTNSTCADAVGYSMTGAQVHKAYSNIDTGNLTEGFHKKLQELSNTMEPKPINDPVPPPAPTVPEPCVVIPYDVFKRKQDQRKKTA